jgi:hypothetical protein
MKTVTGSPIVYLIRGVLSTSASHALHTRNPYCLRNMTTEGREQ